MPATTQIRTAHRKPKPPGRRKPAPPRPLAPGERAYRELRRRILDNQLTPGATYSDAELQSLLGVNAAALRAAQARLADDGLVEVHGRDGTRILPIALDDLYEVFEIMTALEPMAARRLALQHVTKADLERLMSAIRQMDNALLKDDLVAWAKADELFHKRLIELCGNRRLTAMLADSMDQRHRARMQTLVARPLPVDSNREHAAVVDAVRRHDADAAYSLHHDHLARSAAMLISLLRQSDTGRH